jgi:hypothetical protein
VSEAEARNFTEHTTGIIRQTLGQIGPLHGFEVAAGLQVIGTIQDPTHHVPLG